MSSVPLPRSTPQAEGIDPNAILWFVDALEADDLETHSFMLMRHGKVVAEGWWQPYERDALHKLYSLSKSFTSSAIGLAVGEGRMSVDDLDTGFFPDDLPDEISPNLAAMRVRDLLSMSCGQDSDDMGALWQGDGDWVRGFLARPVPFAPGTHFLYNSTATYMLSAIVQKVTGQKLLDYLRPRLLDRIGISGATWDECPMGINTGGWGLSITTDSIARFGQLYLQDGVWEGHRILPEGWVAEASRKHVENGTDPDSDWAQGYGYQFWRSKPSGAFRGDGAFGQFCIVMPEQDAVVAITGGGGDMQRTMSHVWKHLLPAMGPAPASGDESELVARLATLALPPKTTASGTLPAAVAGRTYRPEPEEKVQWLRLDQSAEGVRLTYADEKGEHSFVAGGEAWLNGKLDADQWDDPAMAARLVDLSESGLAIKVCWLGGPDSRLIRIHYHQDEIRVAITRRGTFLPAEGPEFTAAADPI